MRKQLLGFGPFEFDAGRSLLFRGEAPVALGQRGAALLGLLLKRRGEVLSKEELIEAAWPGVIVEEANLSVQISALRRALGPTSGGGEWIVTVQRIGYRFLPAAEAEVSASTVPRLAVLPFTDFGTGAQSDADGLVEDLTTTLSLFKSIEVVARSARFGGRAAGDVSEFIRRRGVGYLVDGSVRRIGNSLRINVQLIDAPSGSQLWAEIFDHAGYPGNPADPLPLRIAAMVEPQIKIAEIARSRAERPESMSAYDLYLRARGHQNSNREGDNTIAHGLLQRALRQEPENFYILAAAAETLHYRDAIGWPAFGRNDREEALDMANRGVALGIKDAATLGTFGLTMMTAREWDLGRVTLERAVEANPYDSAALTTAAQGWLWLVENDRAREYYERAYALGPGDHSRRYTLNGLSVVERRRGNYEAGVEFAKRGLSVAPAHSPLHWNLIASTVQLGRMDEARHYLRRFRALSAAVTVGSIRNGQAIVDERVRDQFVGTLAEAGLPEA